MNQTLLIIGYVWPEPSSSAAGTRMMQLITLFQTHHWQITFASPSNLGEHRLDLTTLGISEKNIALNHASFDQFIGELKPNAVIFDRFMMEEQFGWRVEAVCPEAVRILNTEDLHSLREARQQNLKNVLKQTEAALNKSLDKASDTPSKNTTQVCPDLSSLWDTSDTHLFNLMANSDLAKREIASILRCDLTLMISKFEHQLLERVFKLPSKLLFTLPFFYPENAQTLPTFEQRKHFIFIGNFRHAPNWDSVLWLKKSIWPKIRQQIPNAELHIYGAYPAKKVTNLHNPKQGFIVKGWAEDAQSVIANAKIMLAPLRFGAGIKGKLAEAMLYGTPSITTPIGHEAMLPNDTQETDWPGYSGRTEQDLVQQAVLLYNNSTLWHQAQQQGFKLGHQQYQHPNRAEQFITTLATLNQTQTQLESHRQQNFMGSILRHHHHKSTKYMAQWIEAKNRNTNPK